MTTSRNTTQVSFTPPLRVRALTILNPTLNPKSEHLTLAGNCGGTNNAGSSNLHQSLDRMGEGTGGDDGNLAVGTEASMDLLNIISQVDVTAMQQRGLMNETRNTTGGGGDL